MHPASLANLKPPWKPGERPDGAGRPRNLGMTIKDCLNSFENDGLGIKELRRIATDEDERSSRAIAANLLLQARERPDLATFEPILDGQLSLRELRAQGVDTTVVKKCKARRKTYADKDGGTVEEVEREIELHDRAMKATDMGIEKTDPQPKAESVTNNAVNVMILAEQSNAGLSDQLRALAAKYAGPLLQGA